MSFRSHMSKRIIILLLLATCISKAGATTHSNRKSIGDIVLGANIRPSYVMPTHGFYNGFNESGEPVRTGSTFDLQYSFAYNDSPVLQGIGLGLHTFYAHDIIGTPATLYIFQSVPLIQIGGKMTFGYEWNLGISSGWKINKVTTSSRTNVFVNVAAFFTWRAGRHWDMIFGPEYTHFSNGDTSFPNAGANTINLRVGARRHFSSAGNLSHVDIFSDDYNERNPSERICYDILIVGGWRADRDIVGSKLHIINERFLATGLQFNPLYSFNSHLSAGPSLDLLYDRSADLSITTDEDQKTVYSRPGFMSQTAAGLSLRGEIKMPVFAVNLGIGYNFTYESKDLDGLYYAFALKAFLNDLVFLNITYRLGSVNYAHNLMFGLGFRLARN